jgi:hypothetical protein
LAKQAASKIKIIAIIASLAALALVLSPALSALPVPGAKTTGADSFPADAEFIPDGTVVEQVSDEDLASCNSVNTSVHEILGARNGTIDSKSIASDKLVAEFCSRPALIHEITGADYRGLSLVAYACDSSSGRIGTAAMKDSLSEHKDLYCSSAKQLIVNESKTFLSTIEQFRTEYLPVLEAGVKDDGDSSDDNNNQDINDVVNSTSGDESSPGTNDGSTGQEQGDAGSSFNATAVEATLDEATQSLNECLAQVDANNYYAASQSFDNASKKFIAIFQDDGEDDA